MVVQHNLTAMNSNRMLGLTTKTQAKSTERLSSGYKINRAADDAAGLSISEKMRKQIRGLTQASANAQDGISAVQTAEGALNEVQDMLQRMNELAVKASNGTMSENDRSYVQNEIDALVTEIDRVAETTKFNETYLLKGTGATSGGDIAPTFVDAADNTKEIMQIPTTTQATKEKFTTGAITQTNSAGNNDTTVTVNYVDQNGALKSKDVTFKSGTDAAGTATNLTNAINDDEELSAIFEAGGNNTNFTLESKVAGANQGRVMSMIVKTAGTDAVSIAAATNPRAVEGTDEQKAYAVNTYINDVGDKIIVGNKTYTVATKTNAEKGEFKAGDFNELQKLAAADGIIIGGAATAATFKQEATVLELKLHVGADSTDNNQISVGITSMDAGSLGLKTGSNVVDGEEFKTLLVNGKDDTNARKAIDTITEALQKVSTQRSALGAAQNRLEHTINNLDNVVENTTSAESQIRDTDMASEMVKYSNNNILSQAGQAMLAQANQSNQGVLSLLG